MWSVAVAVVQVQPQGLLVVQPEAGAAQQAEVQDEEEAAEHARLPEPFEGAAVHLHDGRTVRQTEGPGSPIPR